MAFRMVCAATSLEKSFLPLQNDKRDRLPIRVTPRLAPTPAPLVISAQALRERETSGNQGTDSVGRKGSNEAGWSNGGKEQSS